MTRYICKNCNKYIDKKYYEANYCPHCGAQGMKHFRMFIDEENKEKTHA